MATTGDAPIFNDELLLENYESIARNLLTQLSVHQPEFRGLRSFCEKVDKYGAPIRITDTILRAIDPEIKQLQGNIVTVQRFKDISRSQSENRELWEDSGGYLNYITDDRIPTYHRDYVGQAVNLHVRVDAHAQAFFRGDRSTLHYYVYQLGQGHRHFNFIRTFSLDPIQTVDKDENAFYLTLLEMVMCLSFQTLTHSTLATFLRCHGTQPVINDSSVHLNIVPPLYQGQRLNPALKNIYISDLFLSSDPDIAKWPDMRRRLSAQASPSSCSGRSERPRLSDYLPALRKAIDEKRHESEASVEFNKDYIPPVVGQFNLESELESIRRKLRYDIGAEPPLISPIGSLQSRIGLVFDKAGSAIKDPQPSWATLTAESFCPYGMHEMGITKQNALVWPFNLCAEDTLISHEESRSTFAKQSESFKNFAFELISASTVRIILVCGKVAQAEMFGRTSMPQVTRQLGNYGLPAWLSINGSQICRVFVGVPELKKLRYPECWRAAAKFSHGIRFAAILTDTPGIKHNFYQVKSVVSQVLRALVAERKGGPSTISVDKVDGNLRQWLECWGFDDRDSLLELGRLGKSFPEALHMLLIVLSAQSERTKKLVSSATKSIPADSVHNHYDVGSIRAVRHLLLRKRMTTILERDSVDNQDKPPLDTEVFGDVDAQDLEAWNNETEGVIVRRPSSPTLDKAKPRKMLKDWIYSRALRGDACLERMHSEGVVFRRAQNCLCIGNHLLRWPDRCIPRKFRHQESLRVWIDYKDDGTVHPEAWCKGGVLGLQVFAFQVAMPNDPKLKAEYFYPLPSGAQGGHPTAQRRALSLRVSLAKRIVEQRKATTV